jgi:hypothetical protein
MNDGNKSKQRNEGRETGPTIELVLISELQATTGSSESQVWGEMLRRAEVTELVGDATIGKTSLLYRLAVALSRGETFLGIDTAGPMNVLLLDYESSAQLRIQKWDDATEGDRTGINIYAPQRVTPCPITTEWLVEEIKRLNISVVFVDTVMLAIPVDNEDDAPQATRQVNILKNAAQQTDAAILFTHHPTKSGSSIPLHCPYIGRGSGAREATADIVLRLHGKKPVVQLDCHKSRWESAHKVVTMRQIGHGQFEVESNTEAKKPVNGESKGTRKNSLDEILHSFVKEKGTMGCRTAEAIAEGEAHGYTKSQVEKASKMAVKKGTLKKRERGLYTHPDFADTDVGPANESDTEASADEPLESSANPNPQTASPEPTANRRTPLSLKGGGGGRLRAGGCEVGSDEKNNSQHTVGSAQQSSVDQSSFSLDSENQKPVADEPEKDWEGLVETVREDGAEGAEIKFEGSLTDKILREVVVYKSPYKFLAAAEPAELAAVRARFVAAYAEEMVRQHG